MPEIAEVALTAEILEKYLKNKILISLIFISGRYTKKSPNEYSLFYEDLPFKIKKIDTRGKFMWFELKSIKTGIRWYIWNTFGLTGMWSFYKTKYVRTKLIFDDNTIVYFSDMRNFGTFKFDTNKKSLSLKLKKLSPDFLKDNNFHLNNIRKYKLPIVKILMDQTKIGSGIGNYLVAEILYRAKISPHRLGTEFSVHDLEILEYWIKYIIKLSYMDNRIGYMANLNEEQKKLIKKNYHSDIILKEKRFRYRVYRKKFDPKGNPVKAEKIVGTANKKRTTYWVPAVQI